jgi:putative phage-type endonuclease
MNELIDITDTITPDTKNFFNDDEALELYQTCLHIMEEFIGENISSMSEPDFDELFDENIKELLDSQFDSDIFFNEDAEEELEEIVERAKNDLFKDTLPPRSYSDTIILKNPDITYVNKQLYILRHILQPEQRTKEWYEFRHNLITASNAYKAFENQTTQNQLIYEKCQPLNQKLYIDGDQSSDEEKDTKEIIMVNTNTTLHWGQKYEPLSVKYYEYTYGTKVEEFGCIQHDTYKFLGASPDGINVDIKSERYGRMLEIKNIVNREIDGIPKKEYWIQMQLQMEVCKLNECDFLETKFTEYADYNDFVQDSNELDHEDDDGNVFTNVCISKDDKMKGEIMYFHTKEGKPFYAYKSLYYSHPDNIAKWEEDCLTLYQSAKYGYTFMKFIYWKLEIVSCVLVCRNQIWFENCVKDLQALWTTVEQERKTGFDHRAPNRKQKKITDYSATEYQQSGCLLKFNKNVPTLNIVKLDI